MALDDKDGPDDDHDKDNAEDDERGKSELSRLLRIEIELADDRADCARKRREDADGNNEADAVANPFFCDLLANPHEKHGAGCHGEHDDQVKEPRDAKKLEVHELRNDDAWSSGVKLNGIFSKESCLKKRKADGEKPGPFSHFAAALIWAFFDFTLQRRNKAMRSCMMMEAEM